ncbi:unnamed protein product [Rotaria sp. Silwood1]|nr:unnamed protein product [Rotaria sp. Silwood1]
MREILYYAHFSPWRRRLHNICNSKYFDLIIVAAIGLNVVTMLLEFYLIQPAFDLALDYCNYVFTTLNQYQRLLLLEHYVIFKTILKLLKMAKGGIRALLDTVIQALQQVGNLDALRQDDSPHSGKYHLITALAPIYFVIFILVNVVVAILMKKLNESNRIMSDDTEINEEIQ